MTIKRNPADFRVEELLDERLSRSIAKDPRRFALLRLEKTGLTTPDAVTALSRSLHVQASALTYAGLKDKHALTIQHVALEVARLKPGFHVAEKHSGIGWSAELLGWVDASLDASSISGNRFNITVRGISRDASARMEESTKLLAIASTGEGSSSAKTLRVVNYFGDQRFGSSRHMQGFPAQFLVTGDFEKALRLSIASEARKDDRRKKERIRMIVDLWGNWKLVAAKLPKGCPERAPIERLARGGDYRSAFTVLPYFFQRMTVQAYQSYLWNETAREIVEEKCGSTMLTYDGRFGKMSFPPAQLVPEELASLNLPVLGYKSDLVEPWKGAAERVLGREGVKDTGALRIRGVRRPFFGEASRELFTEAKDFKLSEAKREQTEEGPKRITREVSFDLPRGSYATVVLRALGQ